MALTPLFKRPIAFGAVAGLGVGTVGLWLESLWIGAVYHYPWPTSMWGEALAMAVPVAVLTGVCGALMGMVLTGQRLPGRAIGISVVAATVLVIGGAVANGLHIVVPRQDTATITLTDLPSPAGQRMVSADVQLTPPTMVSDHPDWVTILSWQGRMAKQPRPGDRPAREGRSWALPLDPAGSGLGIVEDAAAGPGRLHDDGRADLRTGRRRHPRTRGSRLASSTRPFVQEVTILQRERDQNAPAWLFTAGSIVVLIFTLMVIAALTWGAGRINNAVTEPEPVEEKQPLPESRVR